MKVKKENDTNLQWGFPGPTLRARAEMLEDPSQPKSASNPTKTPGTRVRIGLYNYLDPQSYANAHDCDDAGPNYTPTYPECFHGPEITNLHYHGTHVSPLPHQDYVLLNLWPFGSTGVPIREDTQLGFYQTDINPLPWNQAPGTHWYHPHKHGSTALQVLNGMSGSLIITGAFDDWLNSFYGGNLVDRLLVVQQLGEELDYFNKALPDYPPQALINGLATPQIAMRPGEIQRFRFIGATMQASAALEIGFDERIKEVRQIAQDGVQFAWQNYDRQPYRDSEGTYANFDLAPGNRADFLIQAPMEPGTYLIEHNVFVKRLPDIAKKQVEGHNLDQSLAQRIPPSIKDVESLVGDISNRTLAGNKPPIDPEGRHAPIVHHRSQRGAQADGLPGHPWDGSRLHWRHTAGKVLAQDAVLSGGPRPTEHEPARDRLQHARHGGAASELFHQQNPVRRWLRRGRDDPIHNRGLAGGQRQVHTGQQRQSVASSVSHPHQPLPDGSERRSNVRAALHLARHRGAAGDRPGDRCRGARGSTTDHRPGGRRGQMPVDLRQQQPRDLDRPLDLDHLLLPASHRPAGGSDLEQCRRPDPGARGPVPPTTQPGKATGGPPSRVRCRSAIA